MRMDRCVEQVDQPWVVEAELIRDAQADDALAVDRIRELPLQVVAVLLLHGKNDVGPAD